MSCCFSLFENKRYAIWNNTDLCDNKGDYLFTAFAITGVALLVIGGCLQAGFIPFGGVATPYFLGFGGGLFGLGGLILLLRSCGSR